MAKKRTLEAVPLTRGAEVLHDYSRFAAQPLYSDVRGRFWGTWEPIDIPNSPQDVYVTITEGVEGRLDLLAYRFYQTPELWWVLAEVNGIFFPPEEVAVGITLRVPSRTTLATLGLIR